MQDISQNGEGAAVRSGQWWMSLTGPVTSLVISALLLVGAFGLDLGTEAQRDAALLVGTVTLYVLAPLSIIWLIAAVWARYTRGRAGSKLSDTG